MSRRLEHCHNTLNKNGFSRLCQSRSESWRMKIKQDSRGRISDVPWRYSSSAWHAVMRVAPRPGARPVEPTRVVELAAGDSGALGRRLAARLRGVRQAIHPYAGDRAGRVRPIPIAAISRRGGFLRKPAVARGTLSWKLPNPVDRRRERLTLRRPRMASLSRLPGQGSTVSPDLRQACAQPVGASRPNAVSRTACSSARNGGRSSAERRATNPER